MTKNEQLKKSVFIQTYGCQMNERDSEAVTGLLLDAGFGLADSPEEADVLIFNTCSVRQHAEDKVWSGVGKAAKARRKSGKRQLIGIIGCMAQNHAEGVFERQPGVDFAAGPQDIAKIPGMLKALSADTVYQRKLWETQGQCRPDEVYRTGFRADKEHAFVVISEGCSNFCSYCVVPFTRGPLRHRLSADILDEIRQACAAGISRITLLGQNVNAYSSGGTDFTALLEEVNSVSGLKEFGFITSHPRDTGERLFSAMARLDKCKKTLHLPAQSGSDRILEMMKRGYTRKFYLDLCAKYRKIVVGGWLTTDIIVGFPTEAQEDFRLTFDLLNEVRFDAAFLFKYSPRPHSSAFSLPDDVADEEKVRRHALVLDLQKKISRERMKRQ